jgi:porin
MTQKRGSFLPIIGCIFVASSVLEAEEPVSASPASDSGRTVSDSPKLTGDWWGARDRLSDHGVDVDVNLTQFYQGVAAGGKRQDFEYGGKVDYYLYIDGQRAGLWRGFNIVVHAETRYGRDVNDIDGMFTFGNFNMVFPKAGEEVTAVTQLTVSQSVSDNVDIFLGKINSLDDFRLTFTGRNGVERFMNSAVVANVINARAVPYSTYGAGITVASEKRGPAFTFQIRDADDRATTVDLDELFAHGVLLSGTIKVPVAPMGMPGDQNFGVNWNSRDFTAVDPGSYLNVPGQGIVAGQESGSWALWYTFHQYLCVSESNPDNGLGIFGMAGVSDGNPNPIRWNATLGVGGSSFILGRTRDTFGVGYFYLGLSSDFKDLLEHFHLTHSALP